MAARNDVVSGLWGGRRHSFTAKGAVETVVATGGHYVTQYVTRKLKKKDDLREELITALYPVPEIAEEVKEAETVAEIKQAVRQAPKQIRLDVAPILAKIAKLEKEIQAIERQYEEDEEEEMLIFAYRMVA